MASLNFNGRGDTGLVASTQRVTQIHQKSPGSKPGKSTSGKGVIKSLPTFCEKIKKLSGHLYTLYADLDLLYDDKTPYENIR